MKMGKGVVYFKGQPVAAISREHLWRRDERRVIIAPNVDLGLIVAVMVMFDMCLTETTAALGILSPIFLLTTY